MGETQDECISQHRPSPLRADSDHIPQEDMADSVRASPVRGKAWQASACLELGWSSGCCP